MQQIYSISSLHGQRGFEQIVHSIPVTRCRSIHMPYVLTKLDFKLTWTSVSNSVLILTLPSFLPCSPYITFVQTLPITFHTKPSRCTLSAVYLKHLDRGHHNPPDDELLRLLCTRIKRAHRDNSSQHLPITINIVKV